jgi:hypothetical protein
MCDEPGSSFFERKIKELDSRLRGNDEPKPGDESLRALPVVDLPGVNLSDVN